MLACGKYNLVYEFFDKLEKSLIPGALNYKGSSYNFNWIMLQTIVDISDLPLFVVLVNALWREGKIDEAVMAVKDMESRGIVGSASLYYDLARCLCSGGRCKEALLQVCTFKMYLICNSHATVFVDEEIKLCCGILKDSYYLNYTLGLEAMGYIVLT
jgi:pentatricopeptide repeat protein